jgi:hypothetical protein
MEMLMIKRLFERLESAQSARASLFHTLPSDNWDARGWTNLRICEARNSFSIKDECDGHEWSITQIVWRFGKRVESIIGGEESGYDGEASTEIPGTKGLPSTQGPAQRSYPTRVDSFPGVWQQVQKWLEAEPGLRTRLWFDWLKSQYMDRFRIVTGGRLSDTS